MQLSSCGIYRFALNVPSGYFTGDWTPQPGWHHVAWNYVGPNNGQGIVVYMDGCEVGRHTTRLFVPRPPGDGKMVIGRRFTYSDNWYGAVMIDELMLFNHQLSEQQIQDLYNSY